MTSSKTVPSAINVISGELKQLREKYDKVQADIQAVQVRIVDLKSIPLDLAAFSEYLKLAIEDEGRKFLEGFGTGLIKKPVYDSDRLPFNRLSWFQFEESSTHQGKENTPVDNSWFLSWRGLPQSFSMDAKADAHMVRRMICCFMPEVMHEKLMQAALEHSEEWPQNLPSLAVRRRQLTKLEKELADLQNQEADLKQQLNEIVEVAGRI